MIRLTVEETNLLSIYHTVLENSHRRRAFQLAAFSIST